MLSNDFHGTPGKGESGSANSGEHHDGGDHRDDGVPVSRAWQDAVRDGFVETVGKTPLIRLHGPSEQTGCEILAKVSAYNDMEGII